MYRLPLRVCAAAVLLLPLLLTSVSANAHSTAGGRTVHLRIYSRQPWASGHVYLHQGEMISIQASGSVLWQPRHRRVGPNGLRFVNYLCASAQYSGNAFQAPGINCWSLIGRIGQTVVPFFVGSNFSLKSPTSGRLYLGFNDDAYSDNSGSFKVTVTTH